MAKRYKKVSKYVLDTSVVIEKIASKLIKEKKIHGTIIIPNAVVAELEAQANRGLEIGLMGLEEIQNLRNLSRIKFVGLRPTESQIKFAKSGEIDAYIRELAVEENATLITADYVQAESAKAYGLKVEYFKTRKTVDILKFEKFFDKRTMSIHIKEGSYVYGKKGLPGAWNLIKIGKKKLKKEDVQDISKEIIEKARMDKKAFFEISRKGSTVIQYKNYRIVIVRPPVADGWEITIVRPLKKLNLKDYKLQDELMDKIKEKSHGILISGNPGSGKSTFAQALAEFYLSRGRVVKTVESPRDLQLTDEITQYSKSFTSSEEIHDILFLSRPDNIIFDEMRDTPDFNLYSDLRLAGSECIGVIHSAEPIDSVQRFISRMDVGVIPSVIDTILFVSKGGISKTLSLKMVVKTPTGMTEADLARPVVEVSDFISGKLEYEIYSYGEQTVVIPVAEQMEKSGVSVLAEKMITQEFKRYTKHVEVNLSGNKAVVCVPTKDISRIIGTKGKTIMEIEKKLGISIEVRELKKHKEPIHYDISEDSKYIKLYVEPGLDVDIYVEGDFLFSGISSKKGEIRIHKKSNFGRRVLKALDEDDGLEVRA